jgi:hypothetical protein
MRMAGVRYDPVGAVISLIDEAHESLQTDDLADFLLRVRPLVSTLLAGPAPEPRDAQAGDTPSPAVGVYLGPIFAGGEGGHHLRRRHPARPGGAPASGVRGRGGRPPAGVRGSGRGGLTRCAQRLKGSVQAASLAGR